MSDKWGKIWLIALAVGVVGLGLSLWWQGKKAPETAQATYLIAEAQRRLGCKPYLLSEGLPLDYNQNGAPEYLFSCDSSYLRLIGDSSGLRCTRKKLECFCTIPTRDGR